MLENWLSPIHSPLVNNYFSDAYSCQGNFPDLSDAKVVVFSRDSNFSSIVRKSIGQLYRHADVSFIDIGVLTVDNPSSIYQVITELHDGYILPILLGIDYKCFIEFCSALQLEDKLHNCAFISNTIHLSDNAVHYENLGFQRHIIPKFQFDELMVGNEGLSLGHLRSRQYTLEPILRDINYLHFDMASVRRSDCPSSHRSLPTGLHAAEACQIMRYAGEGMRLKLVSLDTTDLDDSDEVEAMLVAELLWYLHEGISVRPIHHPSVADRFKEYIVELNEVDHSLTFAQSTDNGKWWMKIDNASNKYVACAYEEYQMSIDEGIPDRLLKFI